MQRVPTRLRELLRPAYPDASRPWLQGSFSQVGEDRIVRFLFDVLEVPQPSYLDVGAYHPFHLSNTALFSVAGSTGVNVEPDPDAVPAFLRHRPRDLTLNVGIGPVPGTLTFYRMSQPTLNTFDREAAERVLRTSGGQHDIVETVEIEVRTMAEVLTEIGRCPDFLSLDAEGLDRAILHSLPDWPGRPVAVCVELLACAGVRAEAERDVDIPQLMDHLGYEKLADTWVNAVFVDRDRWF
jgi:FkbM family methyltransferase